MILEDFQDRKGNWLTCAQYHQKCIWTRSGSTWSNMKRRCNPNSTSRIKNPTYENCSMSEGFKNFQSFVEWSRLQVGYNFDFYNLDKDLLVPKNKLYSEDTCVFIPKRLNGFLAGITRKEHELPPGTYFDPNRNRYQVKMQSMDGHVHLGRYDTIEECKMAYRKAKEKEALKWANKILSENIIVDHRVIDCLLNWKCENYE